LPLTELSFLEARRVGSFNLFLLGSFAEPISLDLLVYEDFNFNPMNPSAQPDWVPVVDFNWAYTDLDGTVFSPARYSPVLFLTSWLPPAYDIASTRSVDTQSIYPNIPDRDGNLENVFPGANGDLPTAVPAPPAWLLIGAGVFALRRRPGRAHCPG
jgi:hypothetical protein